MTDKTPAAAPKGATAAAAVAAAEKAAAAEPAAVEAAAVEDVDASGAIQEPGALADVDMDHPAVDSNPRADTTKVQNKIDFNDPTLSDQKAVKANLADTEFGDAEEDDEDGEKAPAKKG